MGQELRKLIVSGCVCVMLCGCNSVAPPKHLSHETVKAELDVAYAQYSRHEPLKADSVVRRLLHGSMNRADSISLSRCYVSILLALDSGRTALEHIEFGFPMDGADDYELMRRHSFRYQAFMADNECDSAWAELARGFELVARNDRLQLKKEDLEHNEAILKKRCPRNLGQ